MTNAEKYEEVFGFKPDPVACPTSKCPDCPNYDPDDETFKCQDRFWHREYKEK